MQVSRVVNRHTKIVYFNKEKITILSNRRLYNETPFINLYQSVIGSEIQTSFVDKLQKKYPKILKRSTEDLQCTLQILEKFAINAENACQNPHLFCMTHKILDNYGEILKECKFKTVLPQHIIRYGVMTKTKTIARLKYEGILDNDLNLEQTLFQYFPDLPENMVVYSNFKDTETNIGLSAGPQSGALNMLHTLIDQKKLVRYLLYYKKSLERHALLPPSDRRAELVLMFLHDILVCSVTVRKSVLEKYLHWKIGLTSEEFNHHYNLNTHMKHKAVCYVKESLRIARDDIKLSTADIRRNIYYVIGCYPTNVKQILDKVDFPGSVELKNVIRNHPNMLLRDYKDLLRIKSVFEEYNLSMDMQNICSRTFNLKATTVRERLKHMTGLKELAIFFEQPKMLISVVNYKRALRRLQELRSKKRCYSVAHLVYHGYYYKRYMDDHRDRINYSDIKFLFESYLFNEGDTTSLISTLKRHPYWRSCPLTVMRENITILKKHFAIDAICANCQILLYPLLDAEHLIRRVLRLREDARSAGADDTRLWDSIYTNIDFGELTDHQLLSLILYEMDRGHHFSGDGVWSFETIKN